MERMGGTKQSADHAIRLQTLLDLLHRPTRTGDDAQAGPVDDANRQLLMGCEIGR